MKRIFSAIILLICSASFIGCSTLNNEDVGTITGGVAGGLLGSTIGQGDGRLLAIAAGTLAGAYIGGQIGKNMDENDKMRMNAALERNSVGQPAYWHNDNTHANYEVVPIKNVTVHGNRYCREYRTIANIGGKRQQVYGTACRQPDGSWKAVN